jgi:hypothetical protein
MLTDFLSSLLVILLSVIQPVAFAPPRVAVIPDATKSAVAAIDARLGAMHKVEAEIAAETRVTAWYDAGSLRKVFVEEFDESYYLDAKELLIYGRRQRDRAVEEAVFDRGKLIHAYLDGVSMSGDPASWEKEVQYARDALADEAAFTDKPMSETGAIGNELSDARRTLDANAATIDAAKGVTVTKSIWGMSTEGAELAGFKVDGELCRVRLSVFAESGRTVETYYLRREQLFLYVREGFDYTIPMYMLRSRIGGYDHARYYFVAEKGGMNTTETVDRDALQQYIELLARPETEFGYEDLKKAGSASR